MTAKDRIPEDAPMPAPTWKPQVRKPEAGDLSDENAGEKREPTKAANSGGTKPRHSPLDSKVANRNAGNRREAGATPRPTDKPLG
ncbi:hypothetical protein [Kumtagia ephedrae]|uniref:hypothetical protein n=1 Tax=Kumtagia ephedrae TaxID=2116701 RepID=UPI0014032797|nr:hypothetical protein [Mesorhizobium ephedrae]